MSGGCCGVSKVSTLCADVISVAEVPVSPREDYGGKIAVALH